MFCKICNKEFQVETEDRTFVFCPYCGNKIILVTDKIQHLKELSYAAKKNPAKGWEFAKELYNTVRRNRNFQGSEAAFARRIGISPNDLSVYIRAYQFALEYDIDTSRMAVTNAARISGCDDIDWLEENLEEVYHKDLTPCEHGQEKQKNNLISAPPRVIYV